MTLKNQTFEGDGLSLPLDMPPVDPSNREQVLIELVERVTQRLAESLDPDAIAQEIAAQSARLLSNCGLLLRQPDSHRLELIAFHHPEGNLKQKAQDFLRQHPLLLDESVEGGSVFDSQPFYAPSLDLARQPEALRSLVEHFSYHSFLSVPIMQEGTPAGVLFGGALPGESRLTAEDFRIARLLASLAGQALTNAFRYRNFRQSVHQIDAARRLEQITRAISQTLDLRVVLKMVRDAVVDALGFDRAGVFIVDEQSRLIRGIWGTDRSGQVEDIRHETFPLDDPDHFGQLVRQEISFYLTQDYQVDLGAHACVPLVAANRVLGILAVDNQISDRPISMEEIERLQPFCDGAAVALRNARLHEALQRQVQSLETLQTMGNEVRASVNPETVLQALVTGAREICQLSESSVFLYDPRKDQLVWYTGVYQSEEGVRPIHQTTPPVLTRENGSMGFRCLDEKRPLAATGPQDSNYSPPEAEWALRENVASSAAIPLFTDTEQYGVLNLIQYETPHRFWPRELTVLQSLASQAAVALQKARLFEEAERALHRANEVNLNLRRAFVPDLPLHAEGLEIGHIFEPALKEIRLGGDFYDLFKLGRRRYGIVMGDVAGHDLDAAMQTAAAKYLLRAYAERSRSTQTVLARLNDALLNQFHAPDFVTLFYGILDLDKGILFYTNGGHEPPQLLLPPSGNELPYTSLQDTDPLLAISRSTLYHQQQVEFPVGAKLILYTDGVTEARRGGEFLLQEGVESLAEAARNESAQGMADAIWNGVGSFADSLNDDVAILVVHRVD